MNKYSKKHWCFRDGCRWKPVGVDPNRGVPFDRCSECGSHRDRKPGDERRDRQQEVKRLVCKIFGVDNTKPKERLYRFLEESIELVQAVGLLTKDEVLTVVNYVFNRPKGDPVKEAGGVGVTLLALCGSLQIDTDKQEQLEVERLQSADVAKFQQKQFQKVLEGVSASKDSTKAFVESLRKILVFDPNLNLYLVPAEKRKDLEEILMFTAPSVADLVLKLVDAQVQDND